MGEITSAPAFSGSSRVCQEALQYTYGPGAVGGGIGWKRLVEFVAYLLDEEPYYRFLHEDAMGSTVAVTDLYGQRLGEIDYLDYGAPLYAPVAVDARRIAGIASGSHADTSKVTLQPVPGYTAHPAAQELQGMELRVVRTDTGANDAVYLAGTVISNREWEVVIHDPGSAIKNAWNSVDKSQVAIYDLNAGYRYGVVDGAVEGTYNTQDQQSPWYGVSCTWITVDAAVFKGGDKTTSPGSADPTWIWIGPNNQDQYKQVMVIGPDADSPSPNWVGGRCKTLALLGDGHLDYVDAGKWYYFEGKKDSPRPAMQAGTWTKDAVGTTFHVPGFADTPGSPSDRTLAHVTANMSGWILQPDINQQVFVPIRGVDAGQGTITVAGGYAGLGKKGRRFRIYALPMVVAAEEVITFAHPDA